MIPTESGRPPHAIPGEATVSVDEILSQAKSASSKFEQGDGTDHIDEAILLGRQALDCCPPGHHMQWNSLTQLALDLQSRYKRLGAIGDIEEAIIYFREAVELCPEWHPNHSASLNNVAFSLFERYKQSREMTDLNEAIIAGRQAFDLCPSGHPPRSLWLSNATTYLSERYDRLREMADLDEAIILARQALDLRPLGHPDRSSLLARVAYFLVSRYRELGEMMDLDHAIIVARQVLDLCPSGHRLRLLSLSNIAAYLSDRYNRLGEIVDLNEAIIFGRQALDLRPLGHPDRSSSLIGVTTLLSMRYKQLGEMMDLNGAIVLARQALDLCPLGHPLRSWSLAGVACSLTDRYHRLEDMTDLNEAIILARQALDLCLSGDPNRSMVLNNIASYVSERYERLWDMTDLNEAIVLARQALDLRPSGHPDRYDRLGDMGDLNEAIILGRQSLDLRPLGHPGRSSSLLGVARFLSNRYMQLGETTDLEEAIILARQGLDLCPSNHPTRSWCLYGLTRFLCVRFNQSRELNDMEDIFNLYTDLTNISQTLSPYDLYAAKQWITAAEDFCHPTVLLAYETSLRLLVQHLAILPSIPNHLQTFKDLASSLAIDAFSACLRDRREKRAVELLEQGRGVFWNQIARLRSPLQDVFASGQEGEALADEFTRLSSEIRNTIHSQSSDQHNRLCNLNADLQSAITNIRNLPGLARFLLPSSFSELRHAAIGGPVVIVNASQYTCDALVVFFDKDPVHIALQITKSRVQDLSSELRAVTRRAKTMDVKNDLGRFLRELWDEVVSPIVDFLQTTVPHRSRIWWCPTAEFSLLPLHAAGPYRGGQRNLSHVYISSYTPTLIALIRARRNVTLAKSSLNKHHFLAVGQATPNGQSKLLSVGSELDIVAKCMQGLATFTRLEGSESSISRVSEELRRNEWVHFASHGVPNEEKPFESAFSLHDGPFTIKRIMGCELEDPQFAYLSACHTTVGYKESPDEVIHLASAMQFAGFRSVIGTMWAVDDAHTNKITSKFYENMLDGSGRLDHTRAALALHKTMKTLAGSVPLDQRILYVHMGA